MGGLWVAFGRAGGVGCRVPTPILGCRPVPSQAGWLVLFYTFACGPVFWDQAHITELVDFFGAIRNNSIL